MKKSFILLFVLLVSWGLPANAAQKVKVTALTPFNSLNPTNKMKVIALERVEFNNGIVFEDGTVVYGDIIEVKQPKRAKLNASFKFKPTSYMYNGKTYTVNDPDFIAKYVQYKELNKVEMATSAAATAGGIIFHIPLLSESVSFVKGAIKNPDDNRFKSGAKQVYKDSIFSYVEEGKDVDIKENTMFILKFKSSDIEDLDDESAEEAPEQKKTEEKPVADEQATKDLNQENTNNNTEPQQEQTQQSLPPAPNVSGMPAKHIVAVDPEKILREVELNTK